MTYYVTVFIFNLSKEHEIASYSKSMLMCSKINPFISGIITLSMILTVSLKSFASYDFVTVRTSGHIALYSYSLAGCRDAWRSSLAQRPRCTTIQPCKQWSGTASQPRQ